MQKIIHNAVLITEVQMLLIFGIWIQFFLCN